MNISLKDIEEAIEYRARLIDKEISLIPYAIDPPELAEVVMYALSQKGKRIRATVLMLSCESVGGSLQKSILPAIAVEMIHNTSLILDDIIDVSETRRGKATINSKWGNNMALIACDVMLAIAIREASKTDIKLTKAVIECASNSMLSLAEGEAMELVTRDYTIDDYYKIADRKTASLFSASAEAGGLVGGGDDIQVNALKQYGRSLGAAFQIRDDVLDFTASKDMLGKPTFIDLKMGRPTLVMLLAKNNGLKREDMLSMTPEELHDALEPCIAKAGRIAEQKALEAKRSLQDLPDGRPKELLLKLSDYVVLRVK